MKSHSVASRVVVQFMRDRRPFSELDDSTLQDLAGRWLIEYFPKGTVIFRQGVTDVTHFCLIQKGIVKLYVERPGSTAILKDLRGEGAGLGASSMIRNQKADLSAEAMEDTFCFLLDKKAFLRLAVNNPNLAHYFLEGLSGDLMMSAYSEVRSERIRGRRRVTFHLFGTKVRDVVRYSAQTISPSTTAREAAEHMSRLGIGSLVVRAPEGHLAGIVTDADLRSRVVAAGLDSGVAVEKIMTTPVRTIPSEALCFEALLQIVRDRVDHLVVENRDEITGVVTSHDIMWQQGAWPVYLFRDIAAQRTVEGLHGVSRKIQRGVRSFLEEGAKASDILRVVSLLNDRILARVLDLVTERWGPAPVPFCWLALGSDGRREQVFGTDQDNALLYHNPRNPREMQAVETYFNGFANQAVSDLDACGFTRCRSDLMASNPRWRKPFAVWCSYFDEWVSSPQPNEVSLAAIFFDFRSAYGHQALGSRLRRRIMQQAQRQHVFQMNLASDCRINWPPLSFFRNATVERNGEHRSRFDLKARGLMPFVNFARLMALRHGVEETNTMQRLRLLYQRGHISEEFQADACEAYEFQMQLYLAHQLHMLEAGHVPHSFVDPAELSDVEKKALKESFGVISRMLELLKKEFPSVVC